MSKKTVQFNFRHLRPEVVTQLTAIVKSPAASIPELSKRQAILASVCIELNDSILAMAKGVQELEAHRSGTQG